jgi:hypothetical protein
VHDDAIEEAEVLVDERAAQVVDGLQVVGEPLLVALSESPGRTKNITNVISVITKKSISAQTSRLRM